MAKVNQSINSILKDVTALPLLSRSASELLNLVSSQDYTLMEIKTIIEQDSVLTLKLLNVVNSAAFSLASEITSIERAIPYLGDKLILNIALEDSAGPLLNAKLDGYMADKGELWEHNVKTAIAAKEITKYSKTKVESGVAYTCGLVHDIGKAIFSTYLDINKEVLAEKFFEDEEKDYLKIERDILGTDHCQVGYMVSKHWKLPQVFSEIIINHHNPSNCPEEYKSICYVIHIADTVAMLIGSGTGMDTNYYMTDPYYGDYLDLDDLKVAKIMDDVEEEFEKMKGTFNS